MADAKTEKQKVQEITEKLEQGIKELFESEKYKTYLNTMSKFHNYSFNNTMLRLRTGKHRLLTSLRTSETEIPGI